MLRIYSVALDVAETVGRLARSVRQHDPDLARQMTRAASSVPLNPAEGSGTRGGNRRLRYQTARGSAMEVRACIELAERLQFVEPLGAVEREKLKHVISALHMLAR